MSVMKRVRDITVASLNDRLERSEDPVKLIDQFLRSTREEIAEADKLLRQYLNHTQQMKQQIEQAKALQEKREEQALLALKAGEEQIAKLALQEKILQEEKVKQYTELYDQSLRAIIELEDQVNLLKSEYQAVYEKRQYYAARMEAVRLQQRMNQRMKNHGTQDMSRMFSRLEDRVSDWELETKSLRDIRRMGQEVALQAGSSLQSLLDRELFRLQQKLEDSRKG